MKKPILIFIAMSSALISVTADTNTLILAKELLEENSFELSAIEFRRFAMESDKDDEKAAAYLYSSYAYLQSEEARSSNEMLDRSEETAATSDYTKEHSLLSAESARLQFDADSALYFYEELAGDSMPADFQTFARRRSAGIYFSQGKVDAARSELEASPADEGSSLEALETFIDGNNKSPLAGGLWGLIPGAGYWYSGEVANGFRSLILNSLFIYGMVSTAEDEQWGAFAIITFFELTWYSGSIYGGVDAAQRYNQDRFETALQGIESDMTYRPDPKIVVPLFKLNIHF